MKNSIDVDGALADAKRRRIPYVSWHLYPCEAKNLISSHAVEISETQKCSRSLDCLCSISLSITIRRSAMWLVHLAHDTGIHLGVRRGCTSTPYFAFFARPVHPPRANRQEMYTWHRRGVYKDPSYPSFHFGVPTLHTFLFTLLPTSGARFRPT